MYNLTSESPKIKQPKGLKILLKEHQCTIVHAMLQIENTGKILLDNRKLLNASPSICSNIFGGADKDAMYEIETSCAILADKVGAGKSFDVIALILKCQTPPFYSRTLLGCNFFNIKLLCTKPTVRANLIIVPHNLMNQWESFLQHSNLKVTVFNKGIDFKKLYINKNEIFDSAEEEDYEEDIIGSVHRRKSVAGKKYDKEMKNLIPDLSVIDMVLNTDVILLNINQYKPHFHNLFGSYKWSRVFIDEIDTIKVPADFKFETIFFWAITATPNNIYSRRQNKFLNSIFFDIRAIPLCLCVKNDNEFVDNSLMIPELRAYSMTCQAMKEVSLIHDMLPSNIMEMINAGNMQGAITKLNCDVHTDESIIEVLTNKMDTELHNLKIELKLTRQMIYGSEEYKEKKLLDIKDKIKSIDTRLESIKERVNGIKEDTCPICTDNFTAPSILNCCKNICCLGCLINSTSDNNTCPFCRAKVEGSKSYYVIDNGVKKMSKKEKKQAMTNDYNKNDKNEVLKNILTNIKKVSENPRILIFSNYCETFVNLTELVSASGLKHSVLSGTSDRIRNILEKYASGEINVLMLDASHYGSGLNLQCTDYLILYHRFTDDIEKQVIGRADRFGRKNPLQLIYLLHQNENNMSDYELTKINKSEELIKMIPNLNGIIKINDHISDTESDEDDSSDEEVVKKKKGKKIIEDDTSDEEVVKNKKGIKIIEEVVKKKKGKKIIEADTTDEEVVKKKKGKKIIEYEVKKKKATKKIINNESSDISSDEDNEMDTRKFSRNNKN